MASTYNMQIIRSMRSDRRTIIYLHTYGFYKCVCICNYAQGAGMKVVVVRLILSIISPKTFSKTEEKDQKKKKERKKKKTDP